MIDAVAAAFARRVTVGIADVRVSADPTRELVTYALGSCVGVVLYDPEVKVMGMLHAMLPEVASAPHQTRSNPAMFVDAGLALLRERCLQMGARSSRLVLTAAGGAHLAQGEADVFRIGERNVAELRRMVRRMGLHLARCDFGGSASRTLIGSVSSGRVCVGRCLVSWNVNQ